MSETTENKKESAKFEETRIKRVLLEAYTTDPEYVAGRSKQLEELSLIELGHQNSIAIKNLHEKLKKDQRSVKIVSRTGTFDDWQLTLPPVDTIGEVTIQAGAGHPSAGVVRLFTGDASALLAAEPGSTKADYAMAAVIAGGHSSDNAALWRGFAESSIRDMQDLLGNVLLLEAMAEQFTTDTLSSVATQTGELAVRSEQS